MEKMNGYDEAQALTGEYEKLQPGGYICKIISAKEDKSQSGKKMLVLALDIEEGEKKGFFKRRYDELVKNNKDVNNKPKYPAGGVYRQMLEGENSVGYLKGLMKSLEESNSGFKWEWDEKKLVNLKCGAIFAEKEYEKMDGSIGVSTKIKWIRSIKAIQEGNFTVPELKKLETKTNVTISADDDDLPF